MEPKIHSTLIGACKDFFGYRPGEGLKDFSAEYKQLTLGDLVEIRAGLEKLGYVIQTPTA